MDSKMRTSEFDWADSDTLIQTPDGKIERAGTCLLISQNIIILSKYTEAELLKLRDSVEAAVSHELAFRKNTI